MVGIGLLEEWFGWEILRFSTLNLNGEILD